MVLSLFYGRNLTSVHDYGKTIALTRWTFVNTVMSLLFNMLSRFVIAFKGRLLISWLQSPSAEILESKKVKSVTASTFPPSICLALGPQGLPLGDQVDVDQSVVFRFRLLAPIPGVPTLSLTCLLKSPTPKRIVSRFKSRESCCKGVVFQLLEENNFFYLSWRWRWQSRCSGFVPGRPAPG